MGSTHHLAKMGISLPQPTMEMKGFPMLKVTHTDPQMAHVP